MQTKKKIEQMWQQSPSIVHQEVSYTMHKQFGIDFAIGKNMKAEVKKVSSSGNLGSPEPTNQSLIEESKQQTVTADTNSGKLKSQ